MKDNYTIVDEQLNSETGYYYIKINTHLGTFEGWTSPDEIDRKYPSAYHASEVALAKALRNFAKAAIKNLKREITIVDNMIKQVCDVAEGPEDIDNSSFRVMSGTLKQKEKEIMKWETRVQALTKSIKERIAARDKIVAGYIKKDKIE